MYNTEELREMYGKTATYMLAYGCGDTKLRETFSGSNRLKKKKASKSRSLLESSYFVLGMDRAGINYIKLKYKKVCNKGKCYTKGFVVSDKTVYTSVVKQRKFKDSEYVFKTWNNFTKPFGGD